MLSLGDVLQSRYRVDRMLDIGALAGHYGGWDLETNREILITEFLAQPNLEDETLDNLCEAFARDAAALAALEHPHLVRVIDHFCAPTTAPGPTSSSGSEISAYLIQHQVPGQTLEDLIQREGAIPQSRVLHWTQQLLDALSYVHARGVCHRDIKPENILITPDDQAILTNFEIVALWNPLDPRTWTAKRVMGTPEYAPPESWGMKMTHVDARSDIYSLGATLYHALTGEQPLTAGERTSNPYRFLQVKSLNPKVTPAVRDVILKAMELPRDKRFQSTEEMSKALQRKPAGDDGGSPPPAPFWPSYGPRPWTRQEPLKVNFRLAALVLLAFAVLAVLLLSQERARQNLAALLPDGTRTTNTVAPSPDSTPTDMTTRFVEFPLLTGEALDGMPGVEASPTPILPAEDSNTTPTPSASSTLPALGPSAASPSGWQIVVDESFSDNRNGWLVSEHKDDWGTTSRQIVDGAYRWTINAAQAVGRWCTPELRDDAGNVSNLHASVDAQRLSGPVTAAYGMILRHVQGSYYVFNVRDDGYYQFSLWYGYEWLPIIDWTQTAAIRTGDVNRITVRAVGTRFELFINNERIAAVDNDQIDRGEVGLSISTAATDGDAVFVFDNFTLWTP